MHTTQSTALFPMTGGTSLLLSVVLLVNKFHFGLVGRKNTTYVVKTSYVVQEK